MSGRGENEKETSIRSQRECENERRSWFCSVHTSIEKLITCYSLRKVCHPALTLKHIHSRTHARTQTHTRAPYALALTNFIEGEQQPMQTRRLLLACTQCTPKAGHADVLVRLATCARTRILAHITRAHRAKSKETVGQTGIRALKSPRPHQNR